MRIIEALANVSVKTKAFAQEILAAINEMTE